MADDWNDAHDIIYAACGRVAAAMAEQTNTLSFRVEQDPKLVFIYEAQSNEALTFRLKGDNSAVEVLRGTTLSIAGDDTNRAPQHPDAPTNTWAFGQVTEDVVTTSVHLWMHDNNLMS